MTTVWKIFNLFLTWLKNHLIAALLSIAAVIGAVQAIIKLFSLSESYVLPTLIGLIFLSLTLFGFWMISDPKLPSDPNNSVLGAAVLDASGSPFSESKEPISAFSPRARRLAKIAIPGNIIIGCLVVFLLLPHTSHPVGALRATIARLDSVRKEMKNDERGRWGLYSKYQEARAAQGEGFWDHVTWAMEVGVSNVSAHNHQLQAPINDYLVSEELTKGAGTNRLLIDFSWVKHPQLTSDLKLFGEYLLKADLVRDKVNSLREKGDLSNYENAKVFNQEICTYWELILCERKTNLTDIEPEKIKGAEERIRSWLKQ